MECIVRDDACIDMVNALHIMNNRNFFHTVDKRKRYVDKVLTYDGSLDYQKRMRADRTYLSTSAQLSFEKF